jgi:hypothetical protein
MAKQGTYKTPIQLNLDYFCLPAFYTWKEIPLTFKLRKFCSNLFSIQTFNKLIQLKPFRNLPPINLQQLTNIINSLNINPTLYTLRNKIILNNLPTMENLNTRYPYLYLTSNCSYCNLIENTNHLLSCSLHLFNPLDIILLNTSNYLTTLKITNISPQLILETIVYQLDSYQLNPNQIILLLIQGTIPTTLFNSLKLILNKQTNKFIILLSNSLLEWFNNSIWFTRNIKHHEWEALRNISTKNKNKKNLNSIFPTSNNKTNNLSSFINPNIDNYIHKYLLQNFTIFTCFY